MPHSDVGTSNLLLASLPAEELGVLRPRLELVALERRKTLEIPNQRPDYVYFLESGIASVVAKGIGVEAEVGIIGREGMTGSALSLEDRQSPFDLFMQVEGAGLRIATEDLLPLLEKCPALEARARLFSRVLGIQTAYTVLANAHLRLEERLCRWLVMVQDRVGKDRFAITHEFMAVMLGVRRPGVTVALHILEGRGLIKSLRGEIVILDRDGLLEYTRGIYGVPESEYRRLLGSNMPREEGRPAM